MMGDLENTPIESQLPFTCSESVCHHTRYLNAHFGVSVASEL